MVRQYRPIRPSAADYTVMLRSHLMEQFISRITVVVARAPWWFQKITA